MFCIIIFSGHQMPASQIQPFNLREPAGEFLFQMLQSTFQLERRRFAVAMTMETFDSFAATVSGNKSAVIPKRVPGAHGL